MPGAMYEIVGSEELMAKLRQLGALTRDEELDALEVGGVIIRDKARDNIRGQGLVKEGGLLESLTVERRDKDVAVGTPLGFRGWIHETGGTITAKRKPYLMIRMGDGFRKKKSVTIPKRAFLRPAVEETKDSVARAIQTKLLSILRTKAGI